MDFPFSLSETNMWHRGTIFGGWGCTLYWACVNPEMRTNPSTCRTFTSVGTYMVCTSVFGTYVVCTSVRVDMVSGVLLPSQGGRWSIVFRVLQQQTKNQINTSKPLPAKIFVPDEFPAWLSTQAFSRSVYLATLTCAAHPSILWGICFGTFASTSVTFTRWSTESVYLQKHADKSHLLILIACHASKHAMLDGADVSFGK